MNTSTKQILSCCRVVHWPPGGKGLIMSGLGVMHGQISIQACRFDFHGHFKWWVTCSPLFPSCVQVSHYLNHWNGQNESLYKMPRLTWSAVTLMYSVFVFHDACAWNVSQKCTGDTTAFLAELQKETPRKYAVLSK